MKKQFVTKKFSPENLAIVDHAINIVNRYEADGYKLSVRQLYYQLVSKNIVENTERSYKRVGDIIADARLAGLCDWDMIEDRNRNTITPAHWNSPSEIIEVVSRSYRIDKWHTQPCYVEVMVEKQALEGVLEPVCRRWDVPFTANKGYSSVSMMFEAGERLIEKFRHRLRAKGLLPSAFEHKRQAVLTKYLIDAGYIEMKPGKSIITEVGEEVGIPRLVVLYMGDHDPSGIDMTRDVLERLSMFTDYLPVEVIRLALNMEQVDELKPPENPAKMTDSRANKYVEEFGESSWELDAVAPEAMENLVSDQIKSLIEPGKWDTAVKREKKEKAELETVSLQFNDAVKAAKKKK